ncbi:toxin VasX [Marinobacter sp. GN3S48]|uniref:toxin VasX n=1 Tax=Marinobacter sp. GN3S48 TaxID=3382302 RepID=UPI00387B4FAA
MGMMVSNPIAAGDRRSQADITAEGACPLTRTDIQLIPVRYAYTDDAANHEALDPRYDLEFKPIGIRQVRDGYLYLFHSDAPDILHEYEVKDGGAVRKRLWTDGEAARDQRSGVADTPAIVVPRKGHIDVLFSSTQLTAKKCSMLIQWDNYRSDVMRRVDLSGYCPVTGKPQLLTKPDLEALLTHPEAQTVPMDGQIELAPWYWAQPSLEKGPEPFAHRLAAYEQDHAYLIVDDLVGHLDDLMDAWAVVDTNHNAWLEKEDAKYYPACFISDLVRLDGERVGEIAKAFAENAEDEDAKELFGQIAQANKDQQARLKTLAEDFPEYQQSTQKVAGPTTYNYTPSDRDRVKAMHDAAQVLADELGLGRREILNVAETIADYQENLVDGSAFSGQQGIADLVKLDDMQAYLAQAQQDLSWFDEEKQRIVADIENLLESFYLHGHLHDRASEASYLAFLEMDNALITILTERAQSDGDFTFLKKFYFEEIGHQHLISLDLKPEIISGTLKDLLDVLKSLMEAKKGPAAYREWVQLVDNSPYLQFPTLPPGAAEQLSHHVAGLGITARLALFELVDAADAADLHGRLRQVFQRMKPGLRAHIFENQRLYEIDLDIADADSLAKHESTVQEIERLAELHEEALSEEKRLEKRQREANSRDRRRYKQEYDQQIGEIRARKQLLAEELKERGFHLMDTSPVEGNNHSGALLIGGITRTTYGRAVQSEVDELKRLKDRGGLNRMLDFGRGMVHGKDKLDLSTRIGGLGLVSFMGMIGAVGAWDAFKKWNKDGDEAELWSFVSGTAGTIGAAASVLTIVGSARLNYYYQSISQADEVLGRLARVNVWGGTIAAWAGFFAAGADWFKQLSLMFKSANSRGTRVGAGVAFVGDSLLVYGSWKMARNGSAGISQVLREVSEDITWKSVNRGMLDLAGGVFRGLNAYLWVGTILVCVGNWVQNYFKRTDIQRWCEQSIWGNESKEWDADQQRHELSKVIYQPTLLVKAEREALAGRTSYCAFRLELPGLSTLQADNMEWSVLRQQGTVWEPDHDYWSQAVIRKSMGTAGFALEVSLTGADLDNSKGFYLAFRYKAANTSDWLPEAGEAYHYKLLLHENGDLPMVGANEDKKWQSIKPLDKPDSRLTALITNFHALMSDPSKT